MRAGKNIRLFENPFLEQCTYVHPVVPAALWLPIISYLWATGILNNAVGVNVSIALAVAGVFVWTAVEYLLHKYIFHFKPNGPIQERLAFLIHGIHHEDPGDERRLLMPPVAGIAIATPLFLAFAAVLGLTYVKPFFAGFLVGYLLYDYTHLAVHFMSFKSSWFKKIKAHHMRHHFVTPDKRYGVSSTLWDHVFGTTGE